MTARQMYDFAIGQVAWYEKQNEFCHTMIEYCNRSLKRSRKEDRELAAYALEHDPNDPLTVRVFGGKYVGKETRDRINERAKYYREIKHNNKRIEHFRSEADYWERYIG